MDQITNMRTWLRNFFFGERPPGMPPQPGAVLVENAFASWTANRIHDLLSCHGVITQIIRIRIGDGSIAFVVAFQTEEEAQTAVLAMEHLQFGTARLFDYTYADYTRLRGFLKFFPEDNQDVSHTYYE